MNERLKQHIDTLFRGAPATQATTELREELLQNLSDKYDDLLREGMSEEQAFHQAVDSLGDIPDLIRQVNQDAKADGQTQIPMPDMAPDAETPKKKRVIWPWIVGGILLFFALLYGICAAVFAVVERVADEVHETVADPAEKPARTAAGSADGSGTSGATPPPVTSGSSGATGNTYYFYDPVDSIDIDWVAGSVTILPATDGVLCVVEEASASMTEAQCMEVMLTAGRLSIDYSSSVVGLSLTDLFGLANMPSKALTVYVPEGELTRIRVGLTAAELSVDNLSAGALTIDGVSGEIDISGCAFGTVKINSVSGSVDLWDTAAGDADVSLVSGSVTFTGSFGSFEGESVSGGFTLTPSGENTLSKIDIDTTSGDVTVFLPADTAFSAEMDSVSGDFDCAFPTVHRGDTYISGENGAEMKFHTISGDVSIRKVN